MPAQQSEKRRTTQPKHEAKYLPPERESGGAYTAALTRLVYSYSAAAAQASASVPPQTWGRHVLRTPIVDDAEMPEVISQSPFVLKSRGATYYVRAVVRFAPSAGLGRFILAVRRNNADAEMPVFGTIPKTDTVTSVQYVEMLLEDDFFLEKNDEMRFVLRFFNDSTTPKTLSILSVQISIFLLQ